MASQTHFGGTASNDNSVGTVDFSGAGNNIGLISDNSYAFAILGQVGVGSTTSHYRKATNFGFTIPTGATINGIIVEIEVKEDLVNGADIVDNAVRIVKGGVIGSENKAKTSAWPLTDTFEAYGSSSDLWSETWTVADINASNFGMVMSATGGSAAGTTEALLDSIRITVYYTPATTTTSTSTSTSSSTSSCTTSTTSSSTSSSSSSTSTSTSTSSSTSTSTSTSSTTTGPVKDIRGTYAFIYKNPMLGSIYIP